MTVSLEHFGGGETGDGRHEEGAIENRHLLEDEVGGGSFDVANRSLERSIRERIAYGVASLVG